MTISDELREYVNRWEFLTGCSPGAMPITVEEGEKLSKECKELFGPFVKCGSDLVPSFIGVDLYITPDAKERRAQITEMK